jgi:hypothetical protein
MGTPITLFITGNIICLFGTAITIFIKNKDIKPCGLLIALIGFVVAVAGFLGIIV